MTSMPSPQPTVRHEDLVSGIKSLGLSGKALCVHSSLRSFGWVEGGADAVVDALLSEGCTVMVPAMHWDNEVPPPTHLRPLQNGFDYNAWDIAHAGEVFPRHVDGLYASFAGRVEVDGCDTRGRGLQARPSLWQTSDGVIRGYWPPGASID